jgi:hypothetical protein
MQGWRPDWSSVLQENVSFEEEDAYVSYYVNFGAPPVGHVLMYIGCDGAPGKVIATEWGTLN